MIKDSITFPDFVKLDLRVGTVSIAEMVPGSERLLRLEIDFGEEVGKRQIVAGIGLIYQPDDLINRQIVAVINLEPKKMMGLFSQGMLLAAGDDEIGLLKPDKNLPNGTIVR